MLELCCPACGRANAVMDAAVLDRACCAECAGPLDEDRPVRYYFAEGGLSHGPRVHRDLEHGVAAGTLRPDMLLSEQGGPWFRAGERADLFPHPRRATVQVPERLKAPRARTRKAPGAVQTMAALELTVGILLLLLTFLIFPFASSAGGRGDGLPWLLVPLSLGVGHIAMANGLRRGSVAAFLAQLVLAGLGGVGVLALATDGFPPGLLLVGGILVAVPFLLLLGEESRAWFRGTSPDA